jgi:hypothetical protein
METPRIRSSIATTIDERLNRHPTTVELGGAAVQAARKRDIIVVALTGRNGGRLRDDVQLLGGQSA